MFRDAATTVRDKGRNSFNNPDDVSALQQQLQALRDKASMGSKMWFHNRMMLSLDSVSCLYGQEEELCLPVWSWNMSALCR